MSLFSSSIRAKLILLILGIVTSIVVALTSVISYTTTQLQQAESERQLLQNQKQSVVLLEKFLEIRSNNVEIWRDNPLIETIFNDSALAMVLVPSLRAQFEKIKEKEASFLTFLLIQEGKIVYDDSDEFEITEGEDGKPDGMKRLIELPDSGVSVANLKDLNGSEDRTVLLIKRPFMQDNEPVADHFMVLVLDLKVISTELFGNLQIGKRGFIALMADSSFGGAVMLPPSQKSMEVGEFMSLDLKLTPEAGGYQEYASVALQYQKLAAYPLYVVGVVSLNDLREPILQLLKLSTLFGLLAIVFGVLSATFFSAKLTNPIRKLTQKAEERSQRQLGLEDSNKAKGVSSYLKPCTPGTPRNLLGSFAQRTRNRRIDELSVLQESFDTMVQTIELDTAQILDITGTFEKFVPKQFLDRITEDGFGGIELGKAESAIITILFSDIRSFTNLSEYMTPQELLDFLNSYLQRMNAPIHENGGFIDKFIGDAIMALFDHPEGTDAGEAQSAILAAIKMQKELKLYNEDRQRWGKIPIKIGIGIHSGPVIIGTVGSEDRMDSTVLGDSVNLASRIEGLTKKYGVGILISDATLALLENPSEFKYRKLDTVCVKGKTKAVSIYEVYDYEDLEIQKKKYASSIFLMKGLAERAQQNWDKAMESFEKALNSYPEDKAVRTHLEYITDLKKLELLDDWSGVISLDEK